ncbi:MAG: ATP-binding cassette domain-containing protein [Pirellulaceae bacterium]
MADSHGALATKTSFMSQLGQLSSRALRIRGLNHAFGEGDLRKQVLFDNNLDVYAGEIVIMTGPSGSGKTTLLTLIGTLRTVQEGSLRVLGRELRGASPAERVAARRDIGFIFQAHNLFPSLTALQNVRMGMELFDFSNEEMNERGRRLLERLGLGHRLHYKPESLSGGQKQRVAIARGLAHGPKLVLADEPTAALDEHSGREVVTLFQELVQEQQVTIVLVTHDNRILDVADRIVNMVDGRIKSDVVVQESAMICEFLQQQTAFKGLTPGTLAAIADKMWAEHHVAGDLIIRQGDPGDKYYLIRHGEVDVLKEEQGESRRLATLKEGEAFGEKALLTGEPRVASVRAARSCLLYVLGKEDFQAAVQSSASFREELQKALFERQ